MNRFVQAFVKELPSIANRNDLFQVLTDCFQAVDRDIYSVCLQVDPVTFEILPVRDIDRLLYKNIEESINQGICAQIVEPNKAVMITEGGKQYSFREGQAALLLPLFYQNVQYGIVFVVMPSKHIGAFEASMEEINIIGAIAAKQYDVLSSLEKANEVNAQLTETKRRLGEIVENVVHGLVALDSNHIVTIFNKNAEIIFGIAATAVIGKSYREIFPEKIVRGFDLLIENTMIEGSILDYEMEVALSPSVKIPVGISSALLRNYQGLNEGIVCVCRDMTLTKEVLRLKDLDKMKSEFVSTVSHELKNPIAIIKSSVETMLAARKMGKSLGEEFEQNSLATISGESNRLSQLINDILSLARMESRRVELRKEQVNIERLITSTMQMFRIHEETHPIKVTVDNVKGDVLMDSEKIKQVLINYVGNAIKYAPKGSPVEVTATMKDGSLVVGVRDHGIGIPADKINILFGKFTRISTPETQNISGTGLGLSICQKILELHHGRVWCESVYKEGSTFYFSLPVSGYSGATTEENTEDA